MAALCVCVQLHGHVCRFQPHVIAQRILDAIHVIVLILQEECRGRLGGYMTLDVGIQRNAVFGKGEVPRINGNGEIRTIAFSVRSIQRRIKAGLEVRAYLSHQISACREP